MASTTRVTSHTVVVGPWGGSGGSAWDDGIYTGIRKITFNYGDAIDSIQVDYDGNGVLISGSQHGGSGGSNTVTIELDPDEYITSLSGYISPLGQVTTNVVRSLTFTTNKNTYGPNGVQYGEPFSLPIKEGFVVGFIGRNGDFLDAIGVRLSL